MFRKSPGERYSMYDVEGNHLTRNGGLIRAGQDPLDQTNTRGYPEGDLTKTRGYPGRDRMGIG